MGDPQTQVPLDTLTTVAVFGVEAGRDGHLVKETSTGRVPPGWAAWDGSVTSDLIARAHAKHVRVVLTVQRFSWTASQSKRTVALLSDPVRRQVLITDILFELAQKHADGVNLDFEPMPSAVAPEYLEFMQELRSAMDAAHQGLQLTFDLTTDIGAWDLPSLTADDAADAALIMGYDFRTGSAPTAGSVDPLQSLSSESLTKALDEALVVVAPERLILGLPWFGRAWSTGTPDAGAATLNGRQYPGSAAVDFGDALAWAQQFGRNYDPTEESAWTVYPRQECASCPEVDRQLWYDDVDGMIAKQSLVVQHGLAGVGIWALGDDHALPDAWQALRVSLGGLIDTAAPSGTAEVDPSVTKRHGDLPAVGTRLRLVLTSSDDAGGSGVAFVRVSTAGTLDADGSLSAGITYPQSDALTVPLTDADLGPATQRGEASVYVQWRDVSGNWSAPEQVSFYLTSTAAQPTPSASTGPVETENPSAEPVP
jgi:spore germination protein YaaH